MLICYQQDYLSVKTELKDYLHNKQRSDLYKKHVKHYKSWRKLNINSTLLIRLVLVCRVDGLICGGLSLVVCSISQPLPSMYVSKVYKHMKAIKYNVTKMLIKTLLIHVVFDAVAG